jgi:hypothetical protein
LIQISKQEAEMAQIHQNYANNLNNLGYTFDGNQNYDQGLIERPKMAGFDERRYSNKTTKSAFKKDAAYGRA